MPRTARILLVLMSNQVHLIVETREGSNLSKIMQGINLSYVYHYRKEHSYTGHFWQDRFKSLLIEEDNYLLECGKYIELNPVRAKIVPKPEDYRWSSYRVYAYGEENALVDINPIYETLGKTSHEKQQNYREFISSFKGDISRMNFYGSKAFISTMEQKYGIKATLGRPGRPAKTRV